MLQRMTRPQHTGTHIVEAVSAVMRSLAGREFGGLYTGIRLGQSGKQRSSVSNADVPFSNVTLVFGSAASGHFGSQAIHGLIRKSKWSDFEDEDR